MSSMKSFSPETASFGTHKPLRRTTHLLGLEQRFMFDGAAATDIHHAAQAQAPDTPPALPQGPAAVEVRAADPARDQGRKEAVLVNTSLADHKALEAGVREGVAIIEFDGSQDGLAQIARWAATQSGFDALHILSHGSEGKLNLGTTALNHASLTSETVQSALATIGHALRVDGDLLLYGCDVGAGDAGQAFLADLAKATGADVTASTDATGTARLGGDWTLEARSGVIEVRSLQISGYDHLLATVTFTSAQGDMQYSNTSVDRTSSSRTFTFVGGFGAGGMGMDASFGAEGLYAYEGTVSGSDIKLTVSIENGYTFDLSSMQVGAISGSVSFVLTYGDNSTASFTQTGITTNAWGTVSSFNTAIDDVKQVVMTSNDFGVFNDFDFTDVKAYLPLPTVTDARIGISGASGTGGAYKTGDTVTATWNNTAGGDNTSGITGVTVDFSQFGGGAAVVATNSSNTWTATYTIVSGAIDATGRNVSVSATSAIGTTTRADTSNAVVDNIAPTVGDARIAISGASGTGGAFKIGDTVTATWNNTAGGDNNIDISGVTVDFSQFGGGSAVAASNSSGTWTATYTIVSGALDTTSRNISFTATDDAGNTTTRADTSNAVVDNVAPTVSDARIGISGASGTGGAYKIGDTVTAAWNNTAGGDNNTDTISSVTVDFSQFGGGSAVAATNSSGTWTATYTLVSGAVDTSNRNVSVTATDNAGNTTTRADTSNATVDNIAPTVTDARIAISGASGTGGAFKIGDTVTATWNNTAGGDNNSDTISSVTVDFSQFGGGSAVAASNSSGTWTATYTLVSGAVDATSRNVSVTATDNAGNATTRADTSNATVDNVAPTVTDARIGISGASGTGGAFKIGDTVTATWNNTAGGDNNSDTISSATVDFSQFGGGSAVAAANSSGTWTATYTLAAGAINGTANRNVSVSVNDNAGNATTTADVSNATVDNVAPTTSVSTATFSADTGTSASDFITRTAAQTISGTLSANVASGESVSVSLDNGSTWAAASTTVGLSTWSLAGQTLGASNTLRVKVQDAAGNDGAVFSQAYVLDTSLPAAPSTPNMGSGTDSGISNTDDITSNTTPTFTGTAESGSTVTLYDTDGSTVLGTATATGGNWSITSSALSAGAHTLTAKASDAAGNVSLASSGLVVGIDTTAPASLNLDTTTILAANAAATSAIATLSATDSQAVTYSLAAGNGTNDADNGSFTISGTSLRVGGATLTAGSYQVYIAATDAAGNVANQAITLTVVDAPSVASIVRAAAASSTVGASATSVDYTVTFDQSVTGVDTGDFTLTATGTASGSVASITGSGTTYTLTVNTLAGDGTLRLDLQSSGTGIQNGSNAAITGGHSAGQTYTLDHTAPATLGAPDMGSGTDSGASTTDDITSNTTPTFTGTAESGSTVTLYDTDGSTVLGTGTATGGNWSITSSALSAGAHTLTAKATDAAGNVSLASAGLAVVIDTSGPNVSSVTVPANGSYKAGDTLDFAVAFNEAVTLDTSGGTPRIALDIGGTPVQADYLSGSGTSSLVFRYTVLGGHNDADGIAVGAMALNVATMKDTAGNNAVLTLNGVGSTAAVLVDSTAPAITFSNLAFSADTGASSSDFITSSASQSITATLSVALASDEALRGSLDNGANWTDITSMVSGTSLTWSGTTLTGNGTLLLKVVDAAGNEGTPTNQAYVLDTGLPAAPSTPDMTTGSDSGASSTDDITSNTTPTFTGTAESGSTVTLYDTDGSTVLGTTTATGGNWSITSSALSTGAHTLSVKATDAAGNVSLASGTLSVVIDTTGPGVSSVTVPANGGYKAGDTLNFTVNTSEAVSVDTAGGTPRLALSIGGATAYADYASGSGSGALVFTYTVQPGDTDGDGIGLTSLQTNGATLRDAAGNTMTLTLNNVGATTQVRVDTTAPGSISVSVPANGTYHDGDPLDFTVQFDEAVTVDASGGTPRIALVIGTTTVQADYLSGSGTNALLFRYTVPSGAQDTDGITVGALNTNGATLRDAAGNDASLTLNSVGGTSLVMVDATQPTVSDVSSTTANGSYKAGDTIAIHVSFSKAVTVGTSGGTPTLALNDGGTATYLSGSGSSTLVFAYTVGAGRDSADLDQVSTTALALNGGTLTDATGSHQNASLTLAAPGTAHSLGANKAIVIDTSAPGIVFSGLALSADTGPSSSDFVTRTAAQTVTATLSATLASGDAVRGSLDNGATWTDITSKISGTTLNWDGVTLTGNGTLVLQVIDTVGNDGAAASQAYVLDTTAPTLAFGNLAFAADTGTSSGDFVTRTAAQTLTATLGNAPAGTDIVQGSLNDGATWTDITSKLSGTTLTWDGITLTGSGTLLLRTVDNAGNASTPASQAYVLDTTAPSITFGNVAFSADTGASATDFITRTAVQTLTATLSAAPAGTDIVQGSLDNGATWTDITGNVSGSTLNWDGATLQPDGTLLLKVTDNAGNDGPVATRAYVLDTTPPALPTFVGLTTTSTTPTLTGTASLADGDTMVLTIEGATYNVTPSGELWSLDLATATPVSGMLALVGGRTFTVTVTVSDIAGNVASASGALNVVVISPTILAPAEPPVSTTPLPPPAEPVLLAAPTPLVTPGFLSSSAQTTLLPPVATGDTQAIVAGAAPIAPIAPTAAPTAATPPARPAAGEARTGTGSAATESTGTLTRGGEGRFQVMVVARPQGAPESLVVNRPMPDQSVSTSGRLNFTVPADTFASTNANTVIQLSAQRADGRPLPAWMSFNARTGQFTGEPPPGATGEVAVRLVARDAQGREAVTTFRFQLGARPSSQATPDGGGRASLSEQIRQAAERHKASASVDKRTAERASRTAKAV
jgi:hypothetical protein